MRKRYLWIPFFLLLFAGGIGGCSLYSALQPVQPGAEKRFFRIGAGERVADVLDRAEREGLIKSASAVKLYSRVFGLKGIPKEGTYSVSPSMPALEVAKRLLGGAPIRQMVLVREGLWASEVADILQRDSVCRSQEFRRLVATPGSLGRAAKFIPAGAKLEGFLFPDTYDLPPLTGPTEAATRMLEAFKRKVYDPLGKPDPALLRKWVIVGSMVELEAKTEPDRPRIAGVIYNRLAKGMPLQIDATLLYALKTRRRLTFKDYALPSAYNTYTNKGLPPGPICSPGASSVFAAAHPAKHKFLYYVAMPNGRHLFAETFEQHKRNIILSRKAFASAH